MAADSERRIIIFNTMAETLLGASRRAVLGRDIQEFLPESAHRQYLQTVLQDGANLHAVPLTVSSGERHLPLTTEAMPVRTADGDIVGVLFVAKHARQQQETEQRMQHLEKLAAIGELAAGTVHEIRNPLTSIKGFTQLIARRSHKTGDQTISEYCSLIEGEICRMENILSEFLTLARPRQQRWEQVDVGRALNDVAALMYGEALLHNITVDTQITAAPLLVYGDVNRLKEVFINLIRNAFQAMAQGGRLTIHAIRDGRSIYIHFRDTGHGMTPDILKHIFQPFFTTKENGTGLGLAICRRTVEEHGGYIEVDSTPGKGTTFTVVLPEQDKLNSREISSDSGTKSCGLPPGAAPDE